MSYKLLAALGGRHPGEALDADLGVKEILLQDAIKRLNFLRTAPRAGGAGYVASRAKVFEDLARQQEIPKLEEDIRQLKQQIKQRGFDYAADGTVTRGPKSFVHYDYTLERKNLRRVNIENHLLRWDKDNRQVAHSAGTSNLDNSLVDTTALPVNALGNAGAAIYVLSAEAHLHISAQLEDVRHHSSFLAGGNIACGGEIRVTQGNITWMSNNSGHYLPNVKHFLQVLHFLHKKGANMNFQVENVVDSRGNYNPGNPQTIDQMMDGLGLSRDYDEVYHFNNLVVGYRDFVNVPAKMATLDLDWRRAANPPGAYKRSTNQHMPSANVRKLINATKRPSGQHKKGVGVAKIADTTDDTNWA
jgi:hypothetical protein